METIEICGKEYHARWVMVGEEPSIDDYEELVLDENGEPIEAWICICAAHNGNLRF